MVKQRLRVPMYFKFLAGCLLLAFLLIFGGSYTVHSMTKLKGRNNYLSKHFKRYLNYQESVGRAYYTVANFIATDSPLRRQLSASGDVNASPGGVSAPGGAPDSAPEPAIGPTLAATAEQIFATFKDKNAIPADLMLIFDASGSHVWSKLDGDAKGQFDPADLADMQAVRRLVDEQPRPYFDQVLVYGGDAYQVAGVPFYHADTQQVIGGLVLGAALERRMREYQRQSDTREHMQHQLTLFVDNQVVASVTPESLWPELADGLLTPRSALVDYVSDGRFRDRSYKQRVINLSVGRHDVYGPGHRDDSEADKLGVRQVLGDRDTRIKNGQMFLLRSRGDQREATIPWTEIAIGIALSAGVAFLLAVWITRPIKSFVVQSRRILEGETDLTQRIQIRSRDETQALARNINTAFERLHQLASEVQSAAFQVGASSAEISAASKQMLSGLKDQTEKIEGSTAAVTELSTSIQQVASNAAEATQVAEKSNVAVTSAVSRMQEIRSSVEEAADKMQDLGESSKRIGNIVEVIRQISEQTSLLALNASIEAAHAGEQGRGFAVVADEVSSLARRVGQSAKDIESLIQTIKEQTSDAVSSMQIGAREVEQGTQLVTDTLTDLRNLIDVVKDTASAVQEQAVVSDEIARSMDAVQNIATEVLSGSEESVVQAQQLHELAYVLEQSVGSFNIDSSKALPQQATGAELVHVPRK